MKIIDYKITDAMYTGVADILKEGWQPLGAPFPHIEIIFQAWVKYEDHDELEKLRAQVKALQSGIELAASHADFAKIIIEQRTNGTNP